MSQLQNHLSAAIENAAVGEVLKTVNKEDIDKFYQLYLFDFVRFEHSCNHKDQQSENKEYQVI